MNGNALKFLIFLSVTFGMTVTTRPVRQSSVRQCGDPLAIGLPVIVRTVKAALDKGKSGPDDSYSGNRLPTSLDQRMIFTSRGFF
jgi:hypothetical protein